MVAGFALSRCVYYALGVRFGASQVDHGLPFIDPELLRHDLASSIWHLHTQPPLFNLFLGLVLKSAGGADEQVLHAIYLGLGLVLALGLYRLMCRLGVRRWPAALLAAAFSATPPAVIYENWFYMEHAVAATLVVAAIFVHRFADTGRTRDAAVAFGLLAVVVLSRTFFHLAWLAAVVIMVWLMQAGRRRRVLAAAALPLAICLAVYVKTLVQFGTFGSTTCAGPNLAEMTTERLNPGERAELVRRGELSEFATLFFLDAPIRRPELFRRERRRGVALLDRPFKSTRSLNLEHAAYVRVCDRYMEDAIASLKADPGAPFRAIQAAGPIYWRPANQYYFVGRPNLRAVRDVDGVYRIMLGQPRRPEVTLKNTEAASRHPEHLLEVAWILLAAYGAVALLGVRALLEARAGGNLAAPEATTLAFILLTAVYVTGVGILFGVGENNRFRYLAEPLVFAALVGLVARRLRRPRRPSPD
jgi:Dolichyl-phosphate-mannose-protein mannosyltransferase